jgi:AcrR family transcriptional regulator
MTTSREIAPNPKRRISSEDRREQIVNVAAELFSKNGFKGTTTKEIAERVGVCEAIIFRHFPTKQELYSSILDHKSKECLKQLYYNCEELMQCRDDRGVFMAMAVEMLEIHRKDQTLLRLLFYCALENHDMAKSFFDTTARRARARVSSYIKQRVEEGAFRKINPSVAARSFFSLVMNRAIVRNLFQDSQWLKSSSREAASEITDIFLNGITISESSQKR